MKLRNKKTGEIRELQNIMSDMMDNHILPSFIAIENEWEDYEEPKEYWYIDDTGVIQIGQVLSSEINMRKSIGNYFNTREEAEKAVEKLKAVKRLKGKGFRFIDHIDRNCGQGMTRYKWDGYVNGEDLDLLFGGEE